MNRAELREYLFGPPLTQMDVSRYGFRMVDHDSVGALPSLIESQYTSGVDRVLHDLSVSSRASSMFRARDVYLPTGDDFERRFDAALNDTFGQRVASFVYANGMNGMSQRLRAIHETVLRGTLRDRPIAQAGLVSTVLDISLGKSEDAAVLSFGYLLRGPVTHAESEAFKERVLDMMISLRARVALGTPLLAVLQGQTGQTKLTYPNFAPKTYEPLNYPGVDARLRRGFSAVCAPDPAARLLVVSGSPGTGKTRAIEGLLLHPNRRDILQQAEAGAILVVPHSLFSDVGGPAILDHLDERRGSGVIGTTLLMEDADDALRARGTEQESPVAALLNMADGILGRAFDVRVVATTNLDSSQMDPAIQRPGRLIDHIHIPEISEDDAVRIFDREIRRRAPSLIPQVTRHKGLAALDLSFSPGTVRSKRWTLAQVYRLVRLVIDRTHAHPTNDVAYQGGEDHG